jgi:hypothetical protein
VIVFTTGIPLTAIPSPLATALAITVFVGMIGSIPPAIFWTGMIVDVIMFVEFGLCVVGVPSIFIATTVSDILVAVPANSPSGRLFAMKCDAVIGFA